MTRCITQFSATRPHTHRVLECKDADSTKQHCSRQHTLLSWGWEGFGGRREVAATYTAIRKAWTQDASMITYYNINNNNSKKTVCGYIYISMYVTITRQETCTNVLNPATLGCLSHFLRGRSVTNDLIRPLVKCLPGLAQLRLLRGLDERRGLAER